MSKKGPQRERRNRLLIFHPTIELGWNRTWVSLLQMRHIGALIDMGRFVPAIGSMIVTTHNKVIREAMANKSVWDAIDYVGFMEYDHEFPRHTIERAFFYREPVVTGLYHYREQPFFPLVYYWNEDRSAVRPAEPMEFMEFMDKPGLHEIGGAPMGCIWIRKDVFEKFGKEFPDEPYFAAPTNKRTDLETGEAEWHSLTDDLWFSRHVTDMGFKIYVDSTVKVKHLVVTAIDERFYIAELNKRLMAAEQKRNEAMALGGEAALPSESEASRLTVVRKEIQTPKLEVVRRG